MKMTGRMMFLMLLVAGQVSLCQNSSHLPEREAERDVRLAQQANSLTAQSADSLTYSYVTLDGQPTIRLDWPNANQEEANRLLLDHNSAGIFYSMGFRKYVLANRSIYWLLVPEEDQFNERLQGPFPLSKLPAEQTDVVLQNEVSASGLKLEHRQNMQAIRHPLPHETRSATPESIDFLSVLQFGINPTQAETRMRGKTVGATNYYGRMTREMDERDSIICKPRSASTGIQVCGGMPMNDDDLGGIVNMYFAHDRLFYIQYACYTNKSACTGLLLKIGRQYGTVTQRGTWSAWRRGTLHIGVNPPPYKDGVTTIGAYDSLFTPPSVTSSF